MEYNVNYSCGHTGVTNLFGKNTERERKIKWIESGLCPECYKKQKNEQAAKENKDNGHPPITIGTPKQIEWAECLRRDMLQKLSNSQISVTLIDVMQNICESTPQIFDDVDRKIRSIVAGCDGLAAKFGEGVRKWFGAHEGAKYYIDIHNQNDTVIDILRLYITDKTGIDICPKSTK